jgi:hypothetical protein
VTASVEVKKSVPVIAEVDVLVAGAGHAGCTAALAAARTGARTMLVDRFGALGGGMGPGLIGGAPNLELPAAFKGVLPGIPGEFVHRCESYTTSPLLTHYFRDSQVISYVWLSMMQESGVQLLLNTWASDPIMDGKSVTGLIVENKSGTQAIKAKVVVDATGDADVAFRAGAQVDDGVASSHPGLYFAMANVDIAEYHARVRNTEPNADDVAWAEEAFRDTWGVAKRLVHLRQLAPFFRPPWESGEYRIVQKIGELGYVTCDHGLFKSTSGVQDVDDPLPAGRFGIIGALTGVFGPAIRSGDAAVMTELEIGVRRYIFETAQFLRGHVPGFQNAYLHMVSPYFHSRGGRSIVSEYPVQMEDSLTQRRFADVIFQADNPTPRVQVYGESSRANQVFYDFPYRQLVPRAIDGLLCVGRAAIIQPPILRLRWMVFLMGQAAGVAAALAARANQNPRNIDVTELQKVLHGTYGVSLGNEARLHELGLI